MVATIPRRRMVLLSQSRSRSPRLAKKIAESTQLKTSVVKRVLDALRTIKRRREKAKKAETAKKAKTAKKAETAAKGTQQGDTLHLLMELRAAMSQYHG